MMMMTDCLLSRANNLKKKEKEKRKKKKEKRKKKKEKRKKKNIFSHLFFIFLST
jgi:phosphate/sulfate permease